MKKMRYDKEADAAYIYLADIGPGAARKTVRLGEDINADLDKDGKLLGIEILSASKHLKRASLASAVTA